MKVFALVRTAIYMTGFVLLWGWAALVVRRFDPAMGVTLSARLSPLGAVLMVVGAVIALLCGFVFGARGEGTPALFDPPREFVATGLYRYVRNPMYVGGVLLLAGFGLLKRSASILMLSAWGALLAYLFVVVVEEPGLENRFGEGYRRYKSRVNRWVPKWPRHG